MALAVMPHIDIPGDNTHERVLEAFPPYRQVLRTRIMARSGNLHGFDDNLAVWAFGFDERSEAAAAYGVSMSSDYGDISENQSPDEIAEQVERASVGPLWVLATRRTGKVKETWRGPFIHLPAAFKRVVDANGV